MPVLSDSSIVASSASIASTRVRIAAVPSITWATCSRDSAVACSRVRAASASACSRTACDCSLASLRIVLDSSCACCWISAAVRSAASMIDWIRSPAVLASVGACGDGDPSSSTSAAMRARCASTASGS